MINEFKYGQTWKIWPFPLSLSLCNAFKLFESCILNESLKIHSSIIAWPGLCKWEGWYSVSNMLLVLDGFAYLKFFIFVFSAAHFLGELGNSKQEFVTIHLSSLDKIILPVITRCMWNLTLHHAQDFYIVNSSTKTQSEHTSYSLSTENLFGNESQMIFIIIQLITLSILSWMHVEGEK